MVKGMTSLGLLSICIPLVWFYQGIEWACALTIAVVLVMSPRRRLLAVMLAVVCAILLVRLELEARHSLPAQWQHETAELEVCLRQPARGFDGYQSAVATVKQQPDSLSLRRLRFTTSSDRELGAGDCVTGNFRLRKPVGQLIPGQFNATRYYFSERIDALASLVEIQRLTRQSNLPAKLYRRAASDFQSQEALAVWSALSLGWSSSLPTGLGDLFEQTQLKHLMVVSGMHVGMVAAWALIIGRLLFYLPGVPFNSVYRLRLAWVALLCGAFVALTGFGFPAVRAWIMLAIPLAALSLGRRLSVLETLAFAAVAITLIRPQAWLSSGAWLSFLLVAIIVRLAQRWSQGDSFGLSLALKMQAMLTLLMVPVTALMGFAWHPLSLLINALMIPLVTLLLLPWSVLILLMPDVAWIDGYEWVVTQALDMLSILAPMHKTAPAWTWWQIALTSGLLWLLLSQSIEGQVRWLMLPVFVATAIGFSLPKPATESFRMTLLDVGHGQAMVMQWPDETWLYDLAGRWQDGSSVARKRLAPWYAREDIEPDGLLVSHADSDHAGGAHWAVRQWPQANLLTGAPGRLMRISGRSGWADCHRSADRGTQLPFRLIPIPVALQTSSNDSSCVILIHTDAGSILVTGDASKTVEYWLLQAHPELFPVAALVVGHHGSQTSSATEFLEASPKALLLVSSGDRYSPRWPNPDLVSYILATGRQLHNTAVLGTFTVVVDKGQMRISDHRSAFRRRWFN